MRSNPKRAPARSAAPLKSAPRFIIAQIALAFVLLAGAALLGLSLKKVMAVSPGFQSDHVLTGEFTIPWQPVPEHRVEVVDRLLELIGQQPGVNAAGIITHIPLGGAEGKTAIAPKNYVPPSGQSLQGHYSYGVNWRLLRGVRHSVTRRAISDFRGLSSSGKESVSSTRFCSALLAQRGALGQRIAHGDERDGRQAVHDCRSRRRRETGGAD